MSFLLEVVPAELLCPRCGEHIRDVSLSGGFEILVAQWLAAELAVERQGGYDVHKSAHFPDRTFQVKYSYPSSVQRKWGSQEVWAWRDNNVEGQADYYVLFGIRERIAFCFLLDNLLWDRFSSGKTSSLLYSSIWPFSRRGRGARSYIHEARLWKHECVSLPEGLIARIERLENYRQLELL